MPDFRAFVRSHLPSLGLPPEREIEIVDELAAQIEDAFEALRARGLSDDDAWRELRRQVPDWNALRDDLLDAGPPAARMPIAPRLRDWLAAGLARDLQSSIRLLVRDRGFTLTTVLTLAVCLGANAAVFTVAYAILLRPLPFPDADRIVAMGDVYPTVTPDDILSNTAPSYFDRLEAVTALEEQALFAPWFDTLTIDGVAEEIRGMRVTPSLFPLLQVRPALGRAFTEADGEIGREQKVILSHGLWQRLYGGDPAAIGRPVRLGWTGQQYTIVGVMPPGFAFFEQGDDGHARAPGEQTQFWIPLAFTPAHRSDDARTRYGFFHVGRLRSGATIEQVRAQLDALNAATFERFPQFGLAELRMYTAVTPLHEALTRRVGGILYLLWGGAAFVLLIGTLNIANLSLVRSSVRARELATRLALGAGRFRVIRQLMLEAMLLAGLGGVAGVAAGGWMLRTLMSGAIAHLPNATSVRMDAAVIGLVLLVAALAGALIGLVPAASLGALNLNEVLAESGRLGTGGRATWLFRRGLVVAQVAISVVLLVGAGLLFASFRNLLAVNAGFDPGHVITATMFPPPSRYQDAAAVVALSDRVLEAARRLPGVVAAGITSNIALSGQNTPATVWADDRPPRPGEAVLLPSVVSVTPGYFEAMATPLVRGRYFGEEDREGTLPAAIVDERLAARLWPGGNPIGKGLRRGGSARYTVAGVVRDVRFESLRGSADTAGTAYFPHTQAPPTGRLRWIAIKTRADPAGVVRALRSVLTAIDPDLPLSDVQTMTQRMAGSVTPQRLAMALAGTFGVVALCLSALGIYGVLAYVVAQRRREIGIRIALGSTARGIFRLVFGEGAVLVAGGLVLGLTGALAVARVLEGHVFGVDPLDPMVLGTVAAATGLVALLACVSPARGAMRVDPVHTLNGQ